MGSPLAGFGPPCSRRRGSGIWKTLGLDPVDDRERRRSRHRRLDGCLPPSPPVRGEHLERLARRGAQLAEGDGVGLIDDGCLHRASKSIVDLGVAAPTARTGVVGAVQACHVVRSNDVGDHRGGVAVAHDEPTAELAVEVGETAGEEPAAVGRRRRPQAIVDDEEWDDALALGERPAQRRVVGETQIAPEPDHACARAISHGGSWTGGRHRSSEAVSSVTGLGGARVRVGRCPVSGGAQCPGSGRCPVYGSGRVPSVNVEGRTRPCRPHMRSARLGPPGLRQVASAPCR